MTALRTRTRISAVALAGMATLFIATDVYPPSSSEWAEGIPFRLTPDAPVRRYVATGDFDWDAPEHGASMELTWTLTALVDVSVDDATLVLALSDCATDAVTATRRDLIPGSRAVEVQVEATHPIGCDPSSADCGPTLCIEALSEGDGDVRATWELDVEADRRIFRYLQIEREE